MTENDLSQQTASLIMDQGFNLAVAAHQAGNLSDAEGLYRAFLQVDPAHPEVNHNLGVLLAQMNQPGLALSYLLAAIDADPACGQYWLSYINVLSQSGQMEEAKQVLAQAMKQGLEGEAAQLLASRLAGGDEQTPVSAGDVQAFNKTDSASQGDQRETVQTKAAKPAVRRKKASAVKK